MPFGSNMTYALAKEVCARGYQEIIPKERLTKTIS